MVDQIAEGRSLYTLDACVEPAENGHPAEGFWEANFKTMTEQVRMQLQFILILPLYSF